MAKKPNPLKQLEDRLNTEDAFLTEFLKDPVGVLKREGVELTPDMAKSVKAQFTDMQLPKIDALKPKPKPRISIEIRISIHF
jgi:hypothetical protein